jgi:benzil reductase ((S)-benzoin forming)
MTDGRVVVITGASRGLGAGMAEALLARGFRLGLCSRGAPTIAPAPGRVVSQRRDVRDPEAMAAFCQEVASELGPIDLWINNAGVLEPISFVRDVVPAAFVDHLAINVGGVLNGSQAFVRHIRATGRRLGVLINVTSGAAQKPYQGWGAYCAGKAAVDLLTRVIDAEEELVRAHAVAPGLIDTAMQATLRSLGPEQFPLVDKFIAIKERGQFNSPAYVADWLVALAFSPRGDEPVVLRVPEEHS